MGCNASSSGGGKKKKGGLPNIERKEFKKTKLDEIDEFFTTVEDPANTVCDLSENLETGDGAIQALALLDEFKDQLADKAGDLKEVLKVVFADLKKNKIKPKLEVADDFSDVSLEFDSKPKGYLGNAVQAILDLFESIKALFENAPALIEQLGALAATAGEFPDKIQGMIESAGLNPMEAVSATKNLGANCKSLGGLPNDLKGLVDAVKDLLETIKGIISGEDAGADKEENPAAKEADDDEDAKEDAKDDAEEAEEAKDDAEEAANDPPPQKEDGVECEAAADAEGDAED